MQTHILVNVYIHRSLVSFSELNLFGTISKQSRRHVLYPVTDFCRIKEWGAVEYTNTEILEYMFWLEVKPEMHDRSVGRGGSRGSLEPPFWAPKDFIYIALIVHFKCPTVGKWSISSLAAIENHAPLSKQV